MTSRRIDSGLAFSAAKKFFPGMPTFTVSPANFLDWRKQNHSCEGMSAYGFGRYTLTGSGHPEAIRMVAATVGLFSICTRSRCWGADFLKARRSLARARSGVELRDFGTATPREILTSSEKNIQLRWTGIHGDRVMRPEFDFPIFSDPDSRTQMWKPLAWTDQERANSRRPQLRSDRALEGWRDFAAGAG